MTKTRAALTELEGAILGLIRLEPGCTPYRVRKIFLASRSAEWSGSAGAVYPAIERLEREKLVARRAKADGRGAKTYRLTRAGEATHDRWLCDVERSIGPGLDPFRTRAGSWLRLPHPKRRKLMKSMHSRIAQVRAELLSEIPMRDAGDQIALDLHVALLDLRLRWISRYLEKDHRE